MGKNMGKNMGLNQSMSRSGFVKTVGVGMAAAATGLGGVARADAATAQIARNPYTRKISDDTIEVYPINPARVPPADENALESHGTVFNRTDVGNVQMAVDYVPVGGTVILRSADKFGEIRPFDFGTDGSVKLTKSVKIIGETDGVPVNRSDGSGILFPNGTPLTQIVGGNTVFNSSIPASVVQNDGTEEYVTVLGPDVTVQGIHFSGATGSPIFVEYCNNANISGNMIDSITPKYNKYVPCWYSSRAGDPTTDLCPPYTSSYAYAGDFYYAFGIDMNPRLGRGNYIRDDVTGTVIVKNNHIDVDYLLHQTPYEEATLSRTVANGMEIVYVTNAVITIAENEVHNTNRTGIAVIEVKNRTQSASTYGNSEVYIQNNYVTTATKGCPTPTTTMPVGIVPGTLFSEKCPGTYFEVSHNHVEVYATLPSNLAASGMNLITEDGMYVHHNQISVGGKASNRGIMIIGSSGCTVADNNITGSGQAAILVTSFNNIYRYPTKNYTPWLGPLATPANYNTISGNIFSGFNAWPGVPTSGYAVYFAPVSAGQNAKFNLLYGGSGGRYFNDSYSLQIYPVPPSTGGNSIDTTLFYP